jgi:hypothetical protein
MIRLEIPTCLATAIHHTHATGTVRGLGIRAISTATVTAIIFVRVAHTSGLTRSLTVKRGRAGGMVTKSSGAMRYERST